MATGDRITVAGIGGQAQTFLVGELTITGILQGMVNGDWTEAEGIKIIRAILGNMMGIDPSVQNPNLDQEVLDRLDRMPGAQTGGGAAGGGGAAAGGGGAVGATGAEPATMADYLRGLESQTIAGRRGVFERQMDLQPFMQFINPSARAVTQQRYFDPVSSQYLLAAAPTELGGFAGWQRDPGATQPAGSTFEEFTGQSVPWSAIGEDQWGYPGKGVSGGYPQPPISGLQDWAPWSRDQWRSRIEAMNLPTVPLAEATSLNDLSRGYLGALSLPEAQAMIRQASVAGVNPIASRAAYPAIARDFSQWESANPTLGGGELLRQWGTGGLDSGPTDYRMIKWA
jgi:hypothetical protein